MWNINRQSRTHGAHFPIPFPHGWGWVKMQWMIPTSEHSSMKSVLFRKLRALEFLCEWHIRCKMVMWQKGKLRRRENSEARLSQFCPISCIFQNLFPQDMSLTAHANLQGLSERMSKVKRLWKSQFSQKISFSAVLGQKLAANLCPTASKSTRITPRHP